MLSNIKLLAVLFAEGEGDLPTNEPIATTTNLNGCLYGKDVATLNCVPAIFQLVLNFIFGFSAIVALFFVFFAGFKFLTSGGDAKQVEGARKTLTYAIIGFIVVLLSFAILKFISAVTGVGCILSFGFNIC